MNPNLEDKPFHRRQLTLFPLGRTSSFAEPERDVHPESDACYRMVVFNLIFLRGGCWCRSCTRSWTRTARRTIKRKTTTTTPVRLSCLYEY